MTYLVDLLGGEGLFHLVEDIRGGALHDGQVSLNTDLRILLAGGEHLQQLVSLRRKEKGTGTGCVFLSRRKVRVKVEDMLRV